MKTALLIILALFPVELLVLFSAPAQTQTAYSFTQTNAFIIGHPTLTNSVALSHDYKYSIALESTVTRQTITNVFEGNNERGCPTCHMLRLMEIKFGQTPLVLHPWHPSEDWHDADERWAITNVVRRIIVDVECDDYQWQSGHIRATNDITISSVTNRWTLMAREWRKE